MNLLQCLKGFLSTHVNVHRKFRTCGYQKLRRKGFCDCVQVYTMSSARMCWVLGSGVIGLLKEKLYWNSYWIVFGLGSGSVIFEPSQKFRTRGYQKTKGKKGLVMVCKVTQFPAFESLGSGLIGLLFKKKLRWNLTEWCWVRARVCTPLCSKGFLSLRKKFRTYGHIYKLI